MVLGRSVTAISENCWVLKTNKVDFHMLGQQPCFLSWGLPVKLVVSMRYSLESPGNYWWGCLDSGCCCCCQVALVVSDSVGPHRRQPTRPCRPWDSPGKNTGVGCHSFSSAWNWKGKVKSLSRVQLLATPRTAAYQAPLSIGFSRQEYWSGMPLPSPLTLEIP